MKRLQHFIVILLCFAACKNDPDATADKVLKHAQETIANREEITDAETGDSVIIEKSIVKKTKADIIDSLFKVSFEGPFTIEEKLDSSTIELFSKMAQASRGKAFFSVNKSTLDASINKIIEEDVVTETDLVLLIDKTASMTDDIAKVKEGLGQIIRTLSKKSKVRLAIGLYGDINYMGKDWFDFEVFDTQYEKAIDFLNNIKLIGNFDDPESVYEAFFEVANSSFWKSSKKRMIILVGDAPPQEAPLSKYTIYDVINKAKENKVFMNFYPVLVNPEIVVEKLSDDLVAKKIISKVYPNPSAGEINFEFTDQKEYSIEVFSLTGTNVFREKRNTWFFTNNFSNLPNGAYILRVFDKEGNFDTQRFVIYH
jgi:hypothetical protein